MSGERNRWLFKTEPGDYSWDDLVSEKRAGWEGVRNALALQNLREVRRGDELFVYHTGSERSIIGIAKVVKGPYPDPDEDDPRFVMVDVRPLQKLNRPVPLKEIRKVKALAGWDLVRIPRLSVMPVSEAQWKKVVSLSRQE